MASGYWTVYLYSKAISEDEWVKIEKTTSGMIDEEGLLIGKRYVYEIIDKSNSERILFYGEGEVIFKNPRKLNPKSELYNYDNIKEKESFMKKYKESFEQGIK